ncbi:YcxD [Paenibacillus mucilaginosus 3016]|uniref:YcxD n=2 Tax=Paenibacillus mucilaginosus TaxID=61624 RepID=H6NFB8_9BACL|nr:PLP-dependent aminotransferase family protein [Paenibacillus mucilaginosus]AFC29527.1 YcxD [Paenibacillus mucilaginosus 3016]AFH61705.1 GntR family transcriptional regulator [Paenibacillus mucilaginosus K02]WFA18226.1 PLP-dependent aminotransferase family protein [Paenibacillus mucilaginosus]
MLKYMELANEIEGLIETLPLREGGKLPSIRTLAQRYECSKSTIIRTLQELERQHRIYAVPKSGYYVVRSRAASEDTRTGVLDFIAAAPDPELFPYLDFQHCINKAIETYKNDLFVYGTPQGLPSLLRVVRSLLASSQIFTETDRLFVTSGVQQALSLLAAMPFPGGRRTVLIEQPGYHLMVRYLQTYGVPARGIRRTAEGIDMEELERLFRGGEIKFFYTMPRFHNPLGCSYTEDQKKQIVRLAAKHDVYLVEDDYMADFEENRRADPLFAHDPSRRVIYLKSFAKILFPGLRLGIAVLPPALAEVFSRHKKLQDIDTSMLSQAALEIYLKSGMFGRHKQRLSRSYAEKARLLQDSLQRAAGQLGDRAAFRPAPAPMIHTHLELHPGIDVPRLAARLARRSVLIGPMDQHYLEGFPRDPLLKLNVSQVKADEIERGVELIAEEISGSPLHTAKGLST